MLIVRRLVKFHKIGGPEGFRKVMVAWGIQNLKDLSKSEFMGPSHGQKVEKVERVQNSRVSTFEYRNMNGVKKDKKGKQRIKHS